ncbi:hypothetical protein ACFLZZ_00280 [Nanoarchaeota archaeon]
MLEDFLNTVVRHQAEIEAAKKVALPYVVFGLGVLGACWMGDYIEGDEVEEKKGPVKRDYTKYFRCIGN